MAMSVNDLYAKFMFLSDYEKRMGLYRKLSSLLKNNFTLMDALSRCYQIESKDGRKKDEPFAIVLEDWQDGLERGLTFSVATQKWVPQNENLMLAAGDITKLSTTLDNIVVVSGGIRKIKKSLFDALSYPLFLFILTFIIIIMVGIYLVPPLSEAGGSGIVWHGVAASLIDLAKFANNYWMHVILFFIIVAIFIWWSMANLSGQVRVFLDRLPPWNMYKISVSVSWLVSLAAIVKSGSSLPNALKMLSDGGSRYLRGNTMPASRLIENGYNLGGALLASHRHFPNDEIIGDLSIYADMNEFDKNLSQIANDYMESSIRKIESLSGILNNVGILIVSAAIAWVVFGTFAMQEQITAVLS